jgi:type 1 fimbriae regulatory protein FimE
MARKKAPRKRARPSRPKNEDVREREWLTEDEVNRVRRAAGRLGRHGHRDATMILVAFRHGLRVSELVEWKWELVDLDAASVYVKRLKGSKSGMHTLERDEVQALKKLAPASRDRVGHVFKSDRQGPLSTSGIRKIVARAGEAAGLPFPIHPHMLRHACGFELTRANKITRVVQDWMGHANIQNTEHYSKLDPGRFKREKMWDRSGRSAEED